MIGFLRGLAALAFLLLASVPAAPLAFPEQDPGGLVASAPLFADPAGGDVDIPSGSESGSEDRDFDDAFEDACRPRVADTVRTGSGLAPAIPGADDRSRAAAGGLLPHPTGPPPA